MNEEISIDISPKLDVKRVLNGLKDFQIKTVDHAFKRLFLSPEGSGRFLVADEVGLGKTIVAKGLIAKTVEHLWEKEERIDILYICSNGDIARQNIRKLQLDDNDAAKFSFATRSTMLPVEISELQKNKINYISLTPGTSLEMNYNLGTGKERVLLYWLLKEEWNLDASTAAMNLLQGDKKVINFRNEIKNFNQSQINQELQGKFIETLRGTDLKKRFEHLSKHFRYARERKYITHEIRKEQNQLIGELRGMLAATSLDALQPDLIILDEFQRFKHLFDETTEAGELATQLFKHSDKSNGAKMLLLSATPYKMYTIYDEQDGEDHYKDFLNTLDFLYKNANQTEQVKEILRAFRSEMYQVGEGNDNKGKLRILKEELENELRNVMSRTERLGASDDRNGMLLQISPKNIPLAVEDVKDFVTIEKISLELEQHNSLEYWKTSPYLLNMMDQYKLKQVFTDALEITEKEVSLLSHLKQNPNLLLSKKDIQKYEKIDMRNMRLRQLVNSYIDTGIWKCLWMPPSAPYYQLSGSFSGIINSTKRLIFSSWRIVPKVITSLLSYEVERRIHDEFDPEMENTAEARKQRSGLLQFAFSDGRLTGMPVMTLLYPSRCLAESIDPMRFLQKDRLMSVNKMRQNVEKTIESMLSLIHQRSTDSEDQNWYWAAPILLDLHFYPEETEAWFNRVELASIWQRGTTGDEEGTKWSDHVEEIRKLLNGDIHFGAMPARLAQVLSLVTLGSPAVCAYRSFLRQDNVPTEKRLTIKDAAAQIGWSFRSYFNIFEFISLIRGLKKDEPYWRKVLEYCVDGCLQAVLDEYIHLLDETTISINEKEKEISERIHQSLTLKATSLSVDSITLTEEEILLEKKKSIKMRARFAQRFGDEKAEDGEKTRASHLRDTFNSPFWPFVLTTTSVGQEGLDFHQYCHAIIHWDLPSNPVDLEQREGRVHRYKGHAVRKNIATKYIQSIGEKNNHPDNSNSNGLVNDNIWNLMFSKAEADREPGESDLVPYWIYPLEEGSHIERHVYAHELSKEFQKLNALRTSLAVYRMVFGQPRQEDLIQFLTDRYTEEEIHQIIGELQIDLSPR
jgi:hypothetical protein